MSRIAISSGTRGETSSSALTIRSYRNRCRSTSGHPLGATNPARTAPTSHGLRVSEACETNVEDLVVERGHRILRITGKGNKPGTIPLVPRTARTIDLAVGERREGPILVRRDGSTP